MENLRGFVKQCLKESDVPISVIARKADVEYNVVYRIKNTDCDSASDNLEKLYTYFTNRPLIQDEQG